MEKPNRNWASKREKKAQRLEKISNLLNGKYVETEKIVEVMEKLIAPGDKVVLEGDNQKQASFLSESLEKVDAEKVNDLHLIMSSISRPEHLNIFEKGIASKIDFSYAGAQSLRVAQMIEDGTMKLGDIHTYLELYGRYFVDLTPRVALIAATKADRHGNLFTGFSTEDTPAIVEATKFRQGIVIAQVNEIVDELPRVDIPGDWVDYVIQSPKPFYIEPLFTRDPALITDAQVLKGMMAIKGIYGEYGIKSLNHGIGFDTAAIELLLPTYGEELGLKGKICTNFILNPHPSMIPAIESGWVESIHCFGGELGMDEYVAARSDIFFVGPDGSMRSNRAFSQTAGHYAIDMFIGGTLQIDPYGNSSTATANRVAGFGGAPNMGCDPKGRRHSSEAWLKCGEEYGVKEAMWGPVHRGKRLVVQLAETFREKLAPGFVEELDAFALAKNANLPIEPVMIYGDDLTHIITEEGIAYLHKCRNMEERTAAIRGIAGFTEVGMKADPKETLRLRDLGVIKTADDFGIDMSRANRSMLAAKNVHDLVVWSKGLYNPPAKFRNW